MRKAQVSMELIIMISILLIMFISISIYSFNKKNEIKATEDYLDRKDNCLKISNLISETYIGGDGTNVVTKSEYNLSIDSPLLIDEKGVSCRYVGYVVNNEVIGDVIIRNVDGEILIENV